MAALLAVLALALGLLAAGTSHAAARVEGRLPLFFLDALHQVAAFVWIGGLFHLVVTALSPRVSTWPALLLPRFSALALDGRLRPRGEWGRSQHRRTSTR